MERVTFLLEETGARLSCLLNPESLVLRRMAGLRRRRSAGGVATGAQLSDDPLLHTGGGTTELTLDLLFDVSLVDPNSKVDDVRRLTGPLWDLAENFDRRGDYGRPPQMRFIWGKSWNIPGVVAAVAERLERFTSDGTPQRSWLRMRMLRTREKVERRPRKQPEFMLDRLATERLWLADFPADQVRQHVTMTEGRVDRPTRHRASETLFQIAFRYYGDESWWVVIAAVNGISDPRKVPTRRSLKIPSKAAVRRVATGR
jgi:hypothetical protein